MYRQRKRDLNLKPNRQLDKRSNRGMIYENEELRMRTIAICEDVDRGQNDIKKLRKENDHLKREIWGLRDECENLEKMLKKVCISANIPEIELEFSKSFGEDDEEEEDQQQEDNEEEGRDEDDNNEGGGGGGEHVKRKNKKLKAPPLRSRRESGTSVQTFDSEVGSYMESMFGDVLAFDQQMEGEVINTSDETTTTAETVILNPEAQPSCVEVVQPSGILEEAIPSTSAAATHHPAYPPWGHQTAIPSELESVREETESAVNSPDAPPPIVFQQINFEEAVLPDPTLITIPTSAVKQDSVDIPEGRKTPVIQITPASSPTDEDVLLEQPLLTDFLTSDLPKDLETTQEIGSSSDITTQQALGCIVVLPKTFKATSEILVGGGGGETEDSQNLDKLCHSTTPVQSEETSQIKHHVSYSYPTTTTPGARSSDQIVLGTQKRATHVSVPPPAASSSSTMPQMSNSAVHHHRASFGTCGYCCCNSDLLFCGYQSEPSLNSGVATTTTPPEQQTSSIFNTLCCRIPPPPTVHPSVTMRSIWNTVDNNIVIGMYQSAEVIGDGFSLDSSEPIRVQEIIDEVEKQFDSTLEKVLGARLLPGRIFISLKNASAVKSFLAHFKNDLVICSNRQTRIHFIEGATTKLTSSVVLSGVPQDVSDLAVISVLNQFGQVVAPLKRRKYKGVDISERIAKMFVVINETRLPDYVNVSGYEVRVRVEHDQLEIEEVPATEVGVEHKTILRLHEQPSIDNQETQPPKTVPQRKYGFVMVPPSPPVVITTATPGSILRPHKPIARSSSSAPRLETLAGALPTSIAEQLQQRTNSVCVGNIPVDQHPSKILEIHNPRNGIQQQHHLQPKVTIAPAPTIALPLQIQPQTSSTPNLQPPPKKPLARLMVSSPGSFPSSPVSSPGTPSEEHGRGFKGFYKNLDPRRTSTFDAHHGHHSQLSQSSSYSPKARRKSSVQFADKAKKNSLPWFGCCSWI